MNYRQSFGLFTYNGIMFNHDSPLRGSDFVMRKITDGAVRISLGLAQELPMGNLEARRDFGHARDYVQAMWLMLQQPAADDYVVATGRAVSIRDICRIAFGRLGLDFEQHVRVGPCLPAAGGRGGDPWGCQPCPAAARLAAGNHAGGNGRRDGRGRSGALARPDGLTRVMDYHIRSLRTLAPDPLRTTKTHQRRVLALSAGIGYEPNPSINSAPPLILHPAQAQALRPTR